MSGAVMGSTEQRSGLDEGKENLRNQGAMLHGGLRRAWGERWLS
jgi:hypothetical protein